MKTLFFILTISVIKLGFLSSHANAQQEQNLIVMARERDQKAIDEAVGGWWTASMKNHDLRIAWWREARFGMFVHWGVYSLPGGEWKSSAVSGYAEHLMRIKKIPRSEYLEMAHNFNPVKFNADEWIKNAKKAGMQYFIITAKHHDGFAMFDSKVSDYNIVKQTGFMRDPMVELAAACKKYGVKFGFYYSHAFDWEDPDAPGNDWDYKNPGGDLNLFGGTNWYDLHPELLPKAIKYVNEKSIPQIKELLNRYHPDILWFDTPHKLPLSENIRILKTIREADTNIVINGRLARSSSINFGDYKNTADRPAEFYPVEGDWEAIPTTNESYGYHKFDKSHKPVSHFIRLITTAASRGGNLLMNIGPMGDGEFDPKDLDILKGIGHWMEVNGESIHGTEKTSLPIQSWGVSTMKGNKIYLHVFNWPADKILRLGGLKSDISIAYLLSDNLKKRISVKRINPLDLNLELPASPPDSINTVIVIESSGTIITDNAPRLLGNQITNRLLAFDSELHGKGFRFGDGKAKRYYVEGWTERDQELIWKFRLNEGGTFKLLLIYAGSPVSEGTFNLNLDNNIVKSEVIPPGQKSGSVYTLDLGTQMLNKGSHELRLSPQVIKKAELMKILEIQINQAGQR